MHMARWGLLFAASIFAATASQALGGSPSAGWMILSGGGEELAPPDAIEAFRRLAGGPGATIVFIPTASSGLRLPNGQVLDVPQHGSLNSGTAEFERSLATLLGVRRVVILHTRDRREANSAQFTQPILAARGVWISGGNAGRLIDAYLGTRTQNALEQLLDRGGVIGGNSAGAIIQGSYVVRGRPDKPVLMAKGREHGFGFLPNVAVNPHFIAAHREAELITVIDWHPELLGIGIDTGAAALVHAGKLQPLGTAKIGVYDNVKRPVGWYYMLANDACLDLRTRRAEPRRCGFAGGQGS